MQNKLSPEHHRQAVDAAKTLLANGLVTEERYTLNIDASAKDGGGAKEFREIIQDKPLEGAVKPSYVPDIRARTKDKSKGIEP